MLQGFGGLAGQWLHQCAALLGVSLVHEDVAVLTAGAMIVNAKMPRGLAFVTLYSGAVLGDFLIYATGYAARRIAWIRRLVIGRNVERARHWLDRHILRVVAVCRIAPGALFPTFIACGWLGVPFRRFAAATMAAAAVYTTATFLAVLFFGAVLLRHFGLWAWGLAALAVAVAGVMRARHPRWSMVAKASSDEPFQSLRLFFRRRGGDGAGEHRGMPQLAAMARKVARAERIPPPVFYLPVGLRWFALAAKYRSLTLPAAANPLMEAGGFWGESKSRCLWQIAPGQRGWIAPFVTHVAGEDSVSPEIDAGRALAAAAKMGLAFPFVVKPDIGWQGFGVRLLHDESELCQYLARYPKGETVILQQNVPYDGEAGVFYVRRPGEPAGRIESLTLRYFPHVTGDGRSCLRDLILRDDRAGFKADFHLGGHSLHSGLHEEDLDAVPGPGEIVRLAFIGSIRVGGLYRDGAAYVTPELTARFDTIARSMPEFYYGRFDIRFRSIDLLKKGEDFLIFEINGAGAEAIEIWDPDKSIAAAYRRLFQAQSQAFEIGDLNRRRGFQPCTVREFLAYQRRQHRLVTRYPPST